MSVRLRGLIPFAVILGLGWVRSPKALAFAIDESLAPGGAVCAGVTNVSFSSGAYVFRCSSYPTAGYRLVVDSGPIRAGLLEVTELETGVRPVTGAGIRWRRPDGIFVEPSEFALISTTTFHHELLPGPIVRLSYVDHVGARVLRKNYDLEIVGRVLVVHAYEVDADSSSSGAYAGFAFGPSVNAINPSEVILPYSEAHPLVAAGPAGARFYMSAYLDWTRSGSNGPKIRQGPSSPSADSFLSSYASSYVAREDGLWPALDETAYVAVSPEPLDAALALHRDPSPHRANLNGRVVWDTYGFSLLPWVPYTDSFKTATEVIRKLGEYGMTQLSVIIHPWQRHGYDCGLPEHYPANPDYGGDADLRALSTFVRQAGHLFALHENYAEIYSNSGSYWEGGANAARDSSGSPVVVNSARSCISPTSYVLASDKMPEFANLESAQIKAAYGPNASFLDVTTQIAADYFVDRGAANAGARTVREGLANALRLNRQMQATYGGPVFGEGGAEPGRSMAYQAGTVDGVEAELTGRESAPLIPDFVLRILKPLMANHGMGYGGRFVGAGPAQISNLHPASFPWDKYRSMQIAFGHAGFMHDATFGAAGLEMIDFYRYWIKEYYTFRALQEDYLSSSVVEILYETDSGQRVGLSAALSMGMDFTRARVYERYSSGLEVVVNHHPTRNWTVRLQGRSHILPPEGWATANAATGLLNYSALVDAQGRPDAGGWRVDVVRAPSYIFVDGRGSPTPISFGLDYFGHEISHTRMLVLKPNGWGLAEEVSGTFRTSSTTGAPGSVVGRADGSTTVSGRLAGGREVSLEIPSGSFGTGVAVSLADAVPSAVCSSAGAAISVTTLASAQPVVPLRLRISYTAAETAGLDMSRLALARVDPLSGACVPLKTDNDVHRRTLTATLDHLSTFQIIQANPGSVDTGRGYPNPVRSRDSHLTVDRVPAGASLRIYSLDGQEVSGGVADASGTWIWRLTNRAGIPVASGVYFIQVRSNGRSRVIRITVLR